ncbi:MAG: ribosome biogenesis GTPase Der [Firmicutes bacterium]|nr:ribosome biogenesis GTPase Der [Bacillota bacterium]
MNTQNNNLKSTTHKPLVAIVGRPNVGKSTFFNRVCGKRISIVKNIPGVTRDRVYADAEWTGRVFTLIDTGGIGIKGDGEFDAEIIDQATVAIETADVIIFMVDGLEGILPADFAVAKTLRASKKPIILCVNKLDNNERDLTYDFYKLGLGEPSAISSEQAKGIGDLLDRVVELFPAFEDDGQLESGISIAVVGKPNVGKSSIINKMLGVERVIVSPISGTTRDAIDTPFTHNEQQYTLIDTAGLRRKRGIEDDSIERYGVLRSLSAIKRADIVLVVFNAEEEISEQDVRIAGLVHEENKPSVIVMNKWDTVEKDGFTIEKYQKRLDVDLAFMDYYKSIYTSATSGKRIEKILAIASEAYNNASRRITTGTLNDILSDAISMNEPPTKNGRRLKIYYATQARTNPPKFIIKVNDESLVHFSYKRYLENCIRKSVDFTGTPIQIIFQNKKAEE